LTRILSSKKFKFFLSAFALLIVCNCLVFIFRKQMLFIDESDNLLGGWLVSKGFQIYKDYYSQHTPLMYYICGVIYSFGAHSVAMVRTYFFFFLSLVWVFMYLRYSKHFGAFTMALYPILYIFVLGYTFLGNTIVSEQVQSNALVILLLEFLLFEKTRTLKYDNYIIISLSVFFSFGTAVNSAFPILVVCIGVFLLELLWFIKRLINERTKLASYIAKTFLRYIILFAAVAIPFLIFILIYDRQHVLSNAYYQIFTFNRQVYSKYNGYGTSVLATLQMPVYMFSGFFITIMNKLSTNLVSNIQWLIDIASNFLFLWLLIKQNRKIAAVISFLMVIMCGTRGYDNFHAIPYYALSSIMIAYLLYYLAYLPIKQSLNYKNLRILSSAVIILFLSSSYFSNFHVHSENGWFSDDPPSKIQIYIDTITNKNDKIYLDNLDYYSYMRTDRLPASRIAGLVPWFADVYQNQVIDDLKANNTKVIVYTPDLDIWGYKAKDYEPLVQKFIMDDYTQLSSSDPGNITWVRNDYVQEARKKLNITQ